ncbi:MAG: NUDIX hydrolase [Alteromonadaceae bacterium]|nr:MAG: NUDIX hydrolase [Alteromonadaceae bacterium]
MNTWHPHVTVATVIEDDGKFLLVEELCDGKTVFNQPAGHLEENETLIDAAKRETLEETGYQVKITGALGVSQYLAPSNGATYLRHSFTATIVSQQNDGPLDSDIIAAHWMPFEKILNIQQQLRSPLVIRDIKRYKEYGSHDIQALYYDLI